MMVEPNLTLLAIIEMRSEIRSEFRRIQSQIDHEFSEIQDRLRRLDERVDGFIMRVEKLEMK
jgi:hypothetical protein